jgi:hypothetical protein
MTLRAGESGSFGRRDKCDVSVIRQNGEQSPRHGQPEVAAACSGMA